MNRWPLLTLIVSFTASMTAYASAGPTWIHETHSYCVGYCVKVQKKKNAFTDATMGVGVGSTYDLAYIQLARYCSQLHDREGKQYQLNPRSLTSNSCADEPAETFNLKHQCVGSCHLSDLKNQSARHFSVEGRGQTPALAYQNLVKSCTAKRSEESHLFTITADQRISHVCN